MNKIKVNEKQVENVKLTFDGQEIEVVPYLGNSLQKDLIKIYFSAYFTKDNLEDRLSAEVVNKMAILDLCTNIDIDADKAIADGSDAVVSLIDSVSSSGLWEKIYKSIKNYREYEYNLGVAVNSRKMENSDLGHVAKKFLDEKISPLIEKFSSMDFSDEKLAEVKSIVSDLGKQLNGTPVGSLIKNGVV